MDWKSYIQKTQNKPSSLLLGEAMLHAHRGLALDIGAGNLVDSKRMVGEGFEVLVVDPNVENKQDGELEILPIKIEDFEFPIGKFALVNAQYSLPFTEQIPKTMSNISDALEKSGIFSGQFFGKDDGWNGREGITTYTREEVEALFATWEIIRFEEEKRTRGTASHGNKFWHVFHVIAAKK